MAVVPLFVASANSLKAELRLSGVVAGTDAQQILEAAMLQARAGLYSRLGVTRIDYLQTLPVVDAPSTADQVLRSIASMCEALWVRCILLDKLPVVFMDNSGGDIEFLNQEGTFRSITLERLNAERQRCQMQIEEWLALLAGEVDIGNAPSVQIHTQSDQSPRVFPNGTLVGRNGRLWGDPTS